VTEQDPVKVVVHVAATPETVFSYFCDEDRYALWMGNEATLEPVPDRKGVMCSPAPPTFDEKAAQQNAKATGTDVGDWGFPIAGSIDVHAAAQANSAVIEKLGSILVRVMPEGPPPGASFVRVVTPSGKVGYVRDDAIGSLDLDQLCYIKDAAGWKIGGYAGGAN